MFIGHTLPRLRSGSEGSHFVLCTRASAGKLARGSRFVVIAPSGQLYYELTSSSNLALITAEIPFHLMEFDRYENSDGFIYSSTTSHPGSGQGSPLRRLYDCDLITFIAIAQSVDVSFVDVDWHRGLSLAGEGANATVQQSLATYRTCLAFKRVLGDGNSINDYKNALSEILILQHPLIRANENIIDLFGVGFDVSHQEGREGQPIPVLVTENASQYGNLNTFLWHLSPVILGAIQQSSQSVDFVKDVRTDTYEWFGYSRRLRLCQDIGQAIQAMHSCNVIHGDLKPENILIFPHSDHGFIAKVIDFGYSVYGFEDDDLVWLPCSKQWRAPEWHHRAFSVRDAKKTDIYSFAKICEWIIFHPRLGFVSSKEETKIHINQFWQYSLCENAETRTGDITFLLSILAKAQKAENGSFFDFFLRSSDRTRAFETMLTDKVGTKAAASFLTSMSEDAKKRAEALSSQSTPHPKSDIDPLHLLSKDLPQIGKNLCDFQRLHFLVRVKIHDHLFERCQDDKVSEVVFSELTFQLALCYELAFGVARDISKSQCWLDRSGHDRSRVSAELERVGLKSSEKSEFRGLISNSLSVDLSERYRLAGLLGDAIEVHSRESNGLLESLGPYADATLIADVHLSLVFETQGQYEEAMIILTRLVDTTQKIWGVDDPLTLSYRLDVGRLWAAQGDYLKAISLAEEILQVSDRATQHVRALEDLSIYHAQICNFMRSAQYARQNWESKVHELGENHPDTISALERLAYATTDIDMHQAEIMESQVLHWRRRILGEDSYFVVGTLKNLAAIKGEIKEKRHEAIELQQEVIMKIEKSPLSSWSELVWALNRKAWFQERIDQPVQALQTRSKLLNRMDDLLSCPEGLALLGEHAANLKLAGRNEEAETLKATVLKNIPLVLKPLQKISSPIIRGIANAYLIDNKFDSEAALVHAKTFQHWEKMRVDLGESHAYTILVQRLLRLMFNEGHIVQCTVYMLGAEHPSTKLAVLRLKNQLSNLVIDDIEVDGYVQEVKSWIEERVVSLESKTELGHVP